MSLENFKPLWIKGFTPFAISAILAIALFTDALEIDNPIAARSFEDLVIGIADAIRQIAVILAVVAIIFAGFKFLTAGISGDTKALTDAKKMFFWILIGTAVTVGATLLAKVVVETVKRL